MDFQAEYRSKLRTPAEAVRAVKNGDWVDYTSGLGFPPLLDAALAALPLSSVGLEWVVPAAAGIFLGRFIPQVNKRAA